MRATDEKKSITESPQERCDTRIWSGQCQQSDNATGENTYLCAVCGTIRVLDHEMHHECFPHISGDTDNLS
jgi:hypothetical protein